MARCSPLVHFPLLLRFVYNAFPTIGLGLVCLAGAWAKDVPVSGIEVYDGPNGAAYVQITDLLINGKSELRTCTLGTNIDKAAYGRLPKVTLDSATSLERGADGVLLLTKDSSTLCVVPSNLKFEKGGLLSPAELADRAVLQGTVLPSSPPGPDTPPPFNRGVKILFVPVPDVELADYLRAERARSTAIWQDYLVRYSTSGHVAQAKESLAALYLKEGEDSLLAYRKSVSASAPSFADLKKAKVRGDEVHELVSSNASANKLRDDVRSELSVLTDKARAELSTYQQALTGHTAGFGHLVAAQKLVGQILDVDALFDPAVTVQKNAYSASQALESSLRTANSHLAAQRFDEAFAAISPYRPFGEEEPRISAVVSAAYKFHFDRGNAARSAEKWQDAVQEYQKACAINKTEEAASALHEAESGWETARNRAAVDRAIQQSQEYQQARHDIDAYEVFLTLTDTQRSMVADRMHDLEPAYVKAASLEARKLQEAHTPIRGKADEVGVQRAYDLLLRASDLNSNDGNLKLRLDLLSETISDYYLQQAKRYLEKPLGSGVGLGWLYLDQAQYYKPDRDDVRDERTKSTAAYQMRSKLSIRVVFRDQTSRRDSAGFAEQLSDAIATGLETSGLPAKVLRPNDSSAVDPNFRLVGDVLQHRPVLNQTLEPMESRYRVGEREIPNDDWNKVNRDYESANLELQSAQRALEGAQVHGKKKEISAASATVADAQKTVQDLHQKLDSIPKTVPNDVIKPYTYTKKTLTLAAVVELSFRIIDPSGNPIGGSTPITRNAERTVVILENVKPEDTEGVKAQGAPPDELQFLTDVEIEARDTLIKTAKERVEELPGKVLEQARKRAAESDLEGAAEAYILYLNSTAEGQTPERGEALRFLRNQFNLRLAGSALAGNQG